jgi:RNA polymerase sigma-70 factor (ECF subfamily)
VESEERELLGRAREGDLESFARFVRLFERRIRGVLGRLLADERDVDEAAQDTFLQAWRHLESFRGDSAPFTWLYKIAVNEALQRLRRKRLPTEELDAMTSSDRAFASGRPLTVEAQALSRQELEFLTARVRELPDESRVPLVLRDLEDWSYKEIADLLDLTVAATKSRIHRARLQVSKEYKAWLTGRPPDHPAGT